jgi:hypothetical protein
MMRAGFVVVRLMICSSGTPMLAMAPRTKRMIDEDQGMQNRGPRWTRQSHPQGSLLCSIKHLLMADRHSLYPGSCR